MMPLLALKDCLFAGEMFAGSTLILVLARLGAAQKSAAARHLAWAGAFAALLTLPALLALAPSPLKILLAAPAALPIERFNDATATAENVITALQPEPGLPFGLPTLVLALGAVWFAGVIGVLVRFAAGQACLALLRRDSHPFALAPADEPKIAAKNQECELRLSSRDTGPISWGLFHPVILLPRNATAWPRERMHAVLLHELAHIRRRDGITQTMSQLACALYWPNPLVWMAARRLHREAEIAADDAVLTAGLKPSLYAGELLALARAFRAEPAALSASAFFMAAPSALEARVESVLSENQSRSGVTSMDVWKIVGLCVLATTAVVFACPTLAQETPRTVPQAAPAVSAAAEAPQPPTTPPAPPASPAEAAPPAAPAEAVPPPPPPAVEERGDREVMIVNGRESHGLTPAERKQIRVVIDKARREAITKAGPEIEKAMAKAKLGEDALRATKPQIDDAMKEVARHRAEIDKALADVQPEIDRALAEVRADLAKEHIDVRIRESVDEALKRAEIRLEVDGAKHGDKDIGRKIIIQKEDEEK